MILEFDGQFEHLIFVGSSRSTHVREGYAPRYNFPIPPSAEWRYFSSSVGEDEAVDRIRLLLMFQIYC